MKLEDGQYKNKITGKIVTYLSCLDKTYAHKNCIAVYIFANYIGKNIMDHISTTDFIKNYKKL